MTESPKYFSLRIELLGIQPLIWRRMMAPVTITLPKLSHAILGAMGWANSHLHQFEIDGKSYGLPVEFDNLEIINEKGTRLAQVLTEHITEFTYLYDFGDGWTHRVVVEGMQPGHPVWSTTVCVAGERACPPEDVGGIPGYMSFLTAISDPTHPENAQMLIWIGGVFDPEGFDVNSANDRIRRMRG